LFNGEPGGTTGDTWKEPTMGQLSRNHGSYVSRFSQAVTNLVRGGFLLSEDATAMRTAAAGPSIGK